MENCTLPEVEIPSGKYGDFSTTVVFRLSSLLKRPSLEIANILVDRITEKKSQLIKMGFLPTVKIEGKGFINFFLDTQKIHQFFPAIAEKRKTVPISLHLPTNYFLEFVSANPTGPLHIGHGRWAVVGSVLSDILQWCGHTVHCEFYVNDCGVQIEKLRESARRIRENIPLEEDDYGGDYMEVFKENLQEPEKYFLEDHKRILSKLKVHFDQFYSESTLHQQKAIAFAIEILQKAGMIYQSEGALWFASSKQGDEKDRVLQKQDGSYTYFAVDIAYHADKLRRISARGERDYKKYINILGSDHHGYISRLQIAFNTLRDAFFNESPPKTLQALLGQLVSLSRCGQPVRMSKRSGEIITLEEVLDEIGVDATRYFLSLRSLDTPLTFDLDVVKKTSAENPLYYVQYAHARICSINRKAQEGGMIPHRVEHFEYDKIADADLRVILRLLLVFDDTVQTAANRLEVYILPTYLYNLSSAFHGWYEKTRFVQEDREKTRQYLCVLKIIQKVLARGLELMGICPVSSM